MGDTGWEGAVGVGCSLQCGDRVVLGMGGEQWGPAVGKASRTAW